MNINKHFRLVGGRSLAAAALSVAALLSSCQKEDINSEAIGETANQPSASSSIVPNRYIVTMKEDFMGAAASDDRQLHARVKEVLQAHSMQDAAPSVNEVFSVGQPGFLMEATAEQIAELRKDARVAAIEPDRVYTLGYGFNRRTMDRPTDPNAPVEEPQPTGPSTQITPPGITRVGGPGNGTGRVAWVMDSGIDFDHPDLNVDRNRSKSFLSSTDGGNYSSPADEYGHGTMVAGIIAARNNNFGSVGVAAGATVVSVRVMNSKGQGNSGKLVQGINYVYQQAKAGDVVNLSLGGDASDAVDKAVQALASKGVYVVIAAGNSRVDCSNMSPARANGTNIFTVSAMDKADNFSSYSNYGSPVDVCEPGNNIYSTNFGKGYSMGSGTSYAAPHLAGIVLLNGGKFNTAGYVKGDPDNQVDPIGKR